MKHKHPAYRDRYDVFGGSIKVNSKLHETESRLSEDKIAHDKGNKLRSSTAIIESNYSRYKIHVRRRIPAYVPFPFPSKLQLY